MFFVDDEDANDADFWGPLTSIVVPDTASIDPNHLVVTIDLRRSCRRNSG